MSDQQSITASNFKHLPVLANHVLQALNNLPSAMLNGGLIIDATLGGGGHSALILEAHPNLRLIGLDQDPYARSAASERLRVFGDRVQILPINFANFTPPELAVIVLADLGVSSPQLDNASRGFSFRLDGPVDMRMNPENGITAAELIERLNEKNLADIIYQYGEEKLSRRIARRLKRDLAEKGPYKGTTDLAFAIAGCYPPKLRHKKIHPATRTFQALRIAVNNELKVLDFFLKNSPDWITPGGLLNIISFHSLEDRQVKIAFKDDRRLERVTRKPLLATSIEIDNNPRSRSAKLRIARKQNLAS